MKIFLLGLIATVFLGNFSASAQKSELSRAKTEVINAQMVVLVEYAKASGATRMSYPDWVKSTGDFNPTKNQTILLKKAYDYAIKKAPACEIMKADNSILYTVAKEGFTNFPNQAMAKEGCNFFCKLKNLLNALIAVVEAVEELFTTIP